MDCRVLMAFVALPKNGNASAGTNARGATGDDVDEDDDDEDDEDATNATAVVVADATGGGGGGGRCWTDTRLEADVGLLL